MEVPNGSDSKHGNFQNRAPLPTQNQRSLRILPCDSLSDSAEVRSPATMLRAVIVSIATASAVEVGFRSDAALVSLYFNLRLKPCRLSTSPSRALLSRMQRAAKSPSSVESTRTAGRGHFQHRRAALSRWQQTFHPRASETGWDCRLRLTWLRTSLLVRSSTTLLSTGSSRTMSRMIFAS